MNPDLIARLCTERLPLLAAGPRDDAGAFPLPDAALGCLRQLIAATPHIRRVFEFGSGRSTHLFLETGLEVTSLEDSERWLDETRRTLPAAALARWTPACQPLARIWHRGAPFTSWRLTPELAARLAAADLVLIDSPVLPPMREHALLLALRLARQALVVVDDVNIPSVERVCRRLVARHRLAHHFTPLGHGLCFLAPATGTIDERRGLLNTLRAWRFYLIRHRFLPAPQPPCAS